MRKLIEEIIGWVGSACILMAFLLTTLEMRVPISVDVLLLNLFGSLGVGWITWKRRAYPALALNLVWAFVATVGLLRLLR